MSGDVDRTPALTWSGGDIEGDKAFQAVVRHAAQPETRKGHNSENAGNTQAAVSDHGRPGMEVELNGPTGFSNRQRRRLAAAGASWTCVGQ